MRKWEKEVLQILREEINALCKGRLPQTWEELDRLARSFGLTPIYHHYLPLQKAVIWEDELHIAVPDGTAQWRRTYLHEIVEAALCWEGCAPYHYPPENPSMARHRLALQFEKQAPK